MYFYEPEEWDWTERPSRRKSLTPISYDPRISEDEQGRLQELWHKYHKDELRPPLKSASDERLAALDTVLVVYAQQVYRDGSLMPDAHTYVRDLAHYVATFEGWKALVTIQGWQHDDYMAYKHECARLEP